MTSTQVDYSSVIDAVAQGYNYTDKGGAPKYEPIPPPDWSLGSAGLGAGALSSTLNDMLTFLEAQIEPSSVTSPDLANAISTTQQPWPSSDSLSMGLAWQRSNDYLDKNGGLPGYNTYMAFDPTAQVGVFVFGNTDQGKAGTAVDNGGRTLFEKVRDNEALRSKFPHPSTAPKCP
jgi:CubicO group peptidase (beta-lactamase class C family)